MPHSRFTSARIKELGSQIYEKSIRPRVDTNENLGKICCIDIETGDYQIDAVGVKAAGRLREAHPDAAIWAVRIGYDAVYAVGGTLARTNP